MRQIVLFISALLLFSGCGPKGLSMEELKKARWEKISPGISYISLEKGSYDTASFYRFRLKYYFGRPGITKDSIVRNSNEYRDTAFIYLTKNQLGNSRRGYLKLNMEELMLSLSPSLTVYLKDSYDSSNLGKDLNALRAIKGVKQVTYISKEMAKQKFLEDHNPDWDEVLDENPLPRSIEITVDPDVINLRVFGDLKEYIRGQLGPDTDFNSSFDRIKTFKNRDIILEYTR